MGSDSECLFCTSSAVVKSLYLWVLFLRSFCFCGVVGFCVYEVFPLVDSFAREAPAFFEVPAIVDFVRAW